MSDASDHGAPLQGVELARALAQERARWLAFLAKRAPAGSDAEDLLQRALERAVRLAGGLRDRDKLVPWFYRVLRRTVADTLAEHARAPARASEEELESLPEPAAEPQDACACVSKLVGELEPRYAELLQRVVLEEQPLREAARELELTENNAAVRMHRARGALRRELERCCRVDSLRACLACTCDAGHRCGDGAR